MSPATAHHPPKSRRACLVDQAILDAGLSFVAAARELRMTKQGLLTILRADRTPRPPTLAKLRRWLRRRGVRVASNADLLG